MRKEGGEGALLCHPGRRHRRLSLGLAVPLGRKQGPPSQTFRLLPTSLLCSAQHSRKRILTVISPQHAPSALAKATAFSPFGLSLPTTSSFPRGYSVHLSSPDHLAAVRAHPAVAHVEPDQQVYASVVQNNAPWGLARIAHGKHPKKGATDYVYPKGAGENVTVYIIDTGVFVGHAEFEGRAVWGKTIPENEPDTDGNGHGTHVAGTIAGKTYGVAKKATVVGVKVLNSGGFGTMSDVIRGVEYAAESHLERSKKAAAADAAAGGKKKATKEKSVANMSLGGGKSLALDTAVDATVDLGVHFAVAAGNENRNACLSSPAGAAKAITVLATTVDDERAWFSNWGSCVDIGAPGHLILSTWIGDDTANRVLSGTSMASPHVAGVVASLLSRTDTEWATLEPKALKSKLIEVSLKKVITNIPEDSNTKNRLLNSVPPQQKHKHEKEEEEEEEDDDEEFDDDHHHHHHHHRHHHDHDDEDDDEEEI
ncbi:serine proteinase [Zopfochytrium polystomum]|nr:serine proteinase [Zopfochytrium polystomum]